MENRLNLLTFAAALLVTSTGCQNMNHTSRGASLGAGLGTLTGAIVGHQSGRGAEGALIGAAAGAVGGGLLGNAEDNREKAEAWQSYANHVEQVNHARERALSARDIVEMTNAPGIDETIIIQAIQNRGVNFDPDKDQLIFLASNNVSNSVIRAIQVATGG